MQLSRPNPRASAASYPLESPQRFSFVVMTEFRNREGGIYSYRPVPRDDAVRVHWNERGAKNIRGFVSSLVSSTSCGMEGGTVVAKGGLYRPADGLSLHESSVSGYVMEALSAPGQDTRDKHQDSAP